MRRTNNQKMNNSLFHPSCPCFSLKTKVLDIFSVMRGRKAKNEKYSGEKSSDMLSLSCKVFSQHKSDRHGPGICPNKFKSVFKLKYIQSVHKYKQSHREIQNSFHLENLTCLVWRLFHLYRPLHLQTCSNHPLLDLGWTI